MGEFFGERGFTVLARAERLFLPLLVRRERERYSATRATRAARKRAEGPSHQIGFASVQSKRMLMGFIGFGSTPPAPPPAEEPPGDEGGDDTGIRVTPAGRSDRSLYRRRGPAAGRYAWAISLGIHAAVLVGAFLAMKYYFRPPAPPKPAAVYGESSGTGSILQSDDSTDLVHGSLSITISPDVSFGNSFIDPKELPAFVGGEPETIATLSDLSPSSGVEILRPNARGELPGTPVPSHRASPATQPSHITTR